MVRKMALVAAVLASLAVFSPAEVVREEVVRKLVEKYQGGEFRGAVEVSMMVAGNPVKTPCRFWVKGSKVRVDMVMNQPGLEEPMEQTMVFDEKGLTMFQKKLGLVMKLDFTILPEELRKQVKSARGLTSPEEALREIATLGDRLKISEKSRDGRNYYLIEVDNIEELVKQFPFTGQQPEKKVTRVSLWVTSTDYTPERLEVFGKEAQPGLTVDFKELVKEKIPESSFDLKIPSDAQVLDITEMLLKMKEAAGKGVSGTQTK